MAVALTACGIQSYVYAAPGDLYVSGMDFNQFTQAVFKFTPAGGKSTFANGLDTPVGLAFDRSINLYVADAGLGTIFKFTPQGTQTTFASGLSVPVGIAFDGSGNLLEADSGSGTILKFAPDGTKTNFASGLLQPFGLAFDQSGNLFVPDSASNTIFKFTSNGIKSTFVSGLNDPAGIAFDGKGNLFEADNVSGTIFKFTADGTKSTFASGLGNVNGLAFDSSGNLLAAAGAAILKFAPDGTQTTFASLAAGNFLAFEPVVEKLRNISARGLVGTGDDVLVGGNELANNAVVVRAIGPSLSKAGVTNPLQDPMLELHDSTGTIIAANDDWQDTRQHKSPRPACLLLTQTSRPFSLPCRPVVSRPSCAARVTQRAWRWWRFIVSTNKACLTNRRKQGVVLSPTDMQGANR